MKLWKWQRGRQLDAEYWKFPLWYFRMGKYGFDAYILKYKADTVLHPHRDPVEGKHWRLNIGWGVANFCSDLIPQIGFRIGKLTVFLFRPDINTHSLYVFERTTKLSFGFVKFD